MLFMMVFCGLDSEGKGTELQFERDANAGRRGNERDCDDCCVSRPMV